MKKVVLIIGLFERDDENKLTAEKIVENSFFIRKIDGFVRFCIPNHKHRGA